MQPQSSFFLTPVRSSILLLGLLVFSGNVHAQSCQAPIALGSYTTPWLATSTCGHQSMSTIGGFLPLLHDHVVVSFAVDHRHTGNINLSADFAAEFYLMPGHCRESAMPIEIFPAGSALALDFNLPTGVYFLVVTANPELPANLCGNISISGTLSETGVVLRAGFDPPGW